MSELLDKIIKVKKASILQASMSSDLKNAALLAIADALNKNKAKIINENIKDLEACKTENPQDPLLKRLKFDEAKINDCIEGLKQLSSLEDPCGRTLMATALDDDLELYRIASPIGVIGVVFESRPDALVQIASLCLKSGNGAVLKGGSEAKNTNRILFEIIKDATESAGMSENWIHLIESREDVKTILALDKYIDLIIPRGSNQFVQYIMNNTKIAVIGHADGICHTYVDESCDLDMAVKVVVDAKTQYVSVCNATETLLVNNNIANAFLPRIADALTEKNVKLILDDAAYEIVSKTRPGLSIEHAADEDWSTEYLDYIISVKTVESVDEAVEHINTYGSGHTDAIISDVESNVSYFMQYVDSANVYHNCSTRFADGFRYGFGAEVGVSTSKIHARGPVGLEGLLIYKYKLFGHGNIVADYQSGRKTFKHKPIK